MGRSSSLKRKGWHTEKNMREVSTGNIHEGE